MITSTDSKSVNLGFPCISQDFVLIRKLIKSDQDELLHTYLNQIIASRDLIDETAKSSQDFEM